MISESDYFSLPNPDELQPRCSVVNNNDPKSDSLYGIEKHDDLDYDQNGQTAADRQNDVEFGTETGHNSQERGSPPPERRIHDRLARDVGGMYDDDNGPDPVSDPRLRRNMVKRHNSSDDSSSVSSLGPDSKGHRNLVRRARRRHSIKYPAGEADEELAKMLRLAVEDTKKEKQCATELEGKEVR
ncbi:hypothetical protein N0V86_009720 [Didymella sp. IMI 355093]|nr:hypothetical protein N0V86_009720 [Didymella sp. IMI 355093]